MVPDSNGFYYEEDLHLLRSLVKWLNRKTGTERTYEAFRQWWEQRQSAKPETHTTIDVTTRDNDNNA